jgi:hypothetical protein
MIDVTPFNPNIQYNPITEEQALNYEIFSTSLIASFFGRIFPRYFVWRGKRRYKRYKSAMEFLKPNRLKLNTNNTIINH